MNKQVFAIESAMGVVVGPGSAFLAAWLLKRGMSIGFAQLPFVVSAFTPAIIVAALLFLYCSEKNRPSTVENEGEKASTD